MYVGRLYLFIFIKHVTIRFYMHITVSFVIERKHQQPITVSKIIRNSDNRDFTLCLQSVYSNPRVIITCI